MNTISGFLIAILLSTVSLSGAARPEYGKTFEAKLKNSKGKDDNNNNGVGNGGGIGSFMDPGGGLGIPGFGSGWGNGGGWGGGGGGGGYGGGYGGPSGGYSEGGTIRPTVVCKEKGPCYKKKLTCPAKCFTSYSRSGKNYGAGGGGGGCTMDCSNKCVAYCQ